MATPKLYYWNVKARGVVPVLIWTYGGVKFDWEKNPDWPAMKDQTPFGQLPFVECGEIKIAQSGFLSIKLFFVFLILIYYFFL
jgi:hypothetical protein